MHGISIVYFGGKNLERLELENEILAWCAEPKAPAFPAANSCSFLEVPAELVSSQGARS